MTAQKSHSRPSRQGARPADAPVILSNIPGSFAHGVLEKRHPALIQQVGDAIPYGPPQRRALDALLEEVTDGTITALEASAFDHEAWKTWGIERYVGRSWFDVPFLWAESYFYRKLLAATGYFDAGPWHGVDPFGPAKQAELHSAAVDDELTALDALPSQPTAEQAQMLLQAALWGNRADLGFRIENAPQDATNTNLVADDSALLWSLLTEHTPATVAVVADNAGRELIPDLVLIDHLLQHHATAVTLHVKPYPYYVSDATMTDLIDSLRRLLQAPGQSNQIGQRLWDAMRTGRLEVRAHPFFCAPLPYSEMPADLRHEFADVTVTIMKGDLNYRRLLGDHLWSPTARFADLTAHFPGPVVALRTLKSDVIAGLEHQQLAILDASGRAWRTSGTHALIQARG